MKRLLLGVVCLAVVGVPRFAFADDWQQSAFRSDGNELLSDCISAVKSSDGEQVSPQDGIDGIKCMAYLNGISDLNMLYRIAAQEDKTPLPQAFCAPAQGIKAGQLARIVVKFLKAHPELLHNSNIMLTWLALKEAFPCKP